MELIPAAHCGNNRNAAGLRFGCKRRFERNGIDGINDKIDAGQKRQGIKVSVFFGEDAARKPVHSTDRINIGNAGSRSIRFIEPDR